MLKTRILALLCALLMLTAGTCAAEELDELWQAALLDSVFADEDEILPLVMITPESGDVTWDEAGERVLLLSWNVHPERYPEGETVTLGESDIWTFTSDEMEKWYLAHGQGVEDWTLRFEQLLGLPQNAGYTHVTAFWVKPEDVIRPAYVTDIASPMNNAFLEEYDEEYRAWFDENILYSYFESEYPWTRLGYTYDWAKDSGEYGLSEFLILGGSEVEIAFTRTTDEFFAQLAQAAAR